MSQPLPTVNEGPKAARGFRQRRARHSAETQVAGAPARLGGNLGDLLVQQGDWQAVWTGQVLREQIRAFLRRSKAPAEAIQLLAAIALVGGVNEDQACTIAKLFELTPTQFQKLLLSVCIAGLERLDAASVEALVMAT